MNRTKELGQAGENLAAQFLCQKGYRILARNLKSRYGEIDIVAADGSTVVVVEVKTKSNNHFGLAAEMITTKKLHKLHQLALELAMKHQLEKYRIDAVAIDWSVSPPKVEHFTGI